MQILLERWLFVYQAIGTRYVAMTGVAFLIFYILFKNRFAGRKIQAKFPKLSDYTRDILYSALSIAIFAVVSVCTFSILKPYSNLYDNVADYGNWYYGFSFVWMFFLHDLYFYWSHRVMHHPKIFKTVHLVHHQSNNPSPFTAYAFHPIEAVFEALIVTIFAFSIPLHRSAIVIYCFRLCTMFMDTWATRFFQLNSIKLGWVNGSIPPFRTICTTNIRLKTMDYGRRFGIERLVHYMKNMKKPIWK